MSQIVAMPKLGLTMTSAKITMWLKSEGDAVSAGESLCEIETDKISAAVESPADGYVLKILAGEWEEKEILAPLCVIGAKGEAWEGFEPAGAPAEAAQPAPGQIAPEKETAGAQPPKRVLASPVAKRLAEENGIDLSAVAGTGADGRIERKDVENALAQRAGASPAKSSAAEGSAGPAVAKRIPLAGARRVAAERLSASKREIPHVYFRVAADATAMIAAKQKAAEAAGNGKKPTFNDVIVKATAKALAEFPEINSTFAGDEIVCYEDVNIGVAVDTEKGLYVPVVRQADKKSLQEIADVSGQIIGRAREGRATPDDLTGGTFTVTNLGSLGIDEFNAIVNPPQAAILAVGRVADTPVAMGGGIHIRPMMNLTLSADHRVIDGALAARFLSRLKAILESFPGIVPGGDLY